MKVHITLLGKEVLPIYYPIKKYTPDVVYIIGTKQNKELAERLQKIFTTCNEPNLRGIIPMVQQCYIIYVDAFDVRSTREECEKIHAEYKHQENVDFMYNLTGGTKIMALAAFAVGQKEEAEIVYTDSKNLKYLSRDAQDEPLDCDLVSDEIFALHGQIFSERELFDMNVMQSSIDAALKVRQFRSDNYYLYDKIREELQVAKQMSGNYPNSLNLSNGCVFKCPTSSSHSGLRTLTITDGMRNQTLLEIKCKDPKEMLLDGKWWEILVAKSVCDLNIKYSQNYRIWMNVKFKPIKNNSTADDKNEVDILVNIGNTLLFVECKSGKFDQNNIYKLRSVKDTYGGEKSKAVLISSHLVDTKSDIWEKAKENRVDIIAPSKKQQDANEQFMDEILPKSLKALIDSLTLM